MSATNTMQAFGAVFQPSGDGITPLTGIVSGGGTGTVAQTGTPSESVTVSSATWLIPGPAPTTQGVFLWTPGTGAVTVGPFTAADATNPRIDVIVAHVLTPGDATTAGDAAYAIITGTPAATPAAPTVPAADTYVAQVRRNVGDTSITSARITAPTSGTPSRSTARVRVPTLASMNIARGTVNLTSNSSSFFTWTHNLGFTPAYVGFQPTNSGSLHSFTATVVTMTSTTVTGYIYYGADLGNAQTNISFRYVAIG